MRQKDIDALAIPLRSIAQQAGAAIMRCYRDSNSDVQLKADQSPVTAADLAAHQVLVDRLAPLVPGCPVVSEEDVPSQAERRSMGCFWLVDPLDGTKEYVARSGEFTVNVALVCDGVSRFGVVYAPAIDTLYWGGLGFGAFRQIGKESVAIQVSGASNDQVCRVVASKSHLNPETQLLIDQLAPVSLVQAGSSLKFCRVAEGLADVYPRLAPTCEWDTAAAQAVLEGAGGYVLDLQGQALRYGKPNVLNPSFVATRDAALISFLKTT